MVSIGTISSKLKRCKRTQLLPHARRTTKTQTSNRSSNSISLRDIMKIHTILLHCCFVWAAAALPATPTSSTGTPTIARNNTDIHGKWTTLIFRSALYDIWLKTYPQTPVVFPGDCPATCPPPGKELGYRDCLSECTKNRWVKRACWQKCKEVCDMCPKTEMVEGLDDEFDVASYPKCPDYFGSPPQPTWTGCLGDPYD